MTKPQTFDEWFCEKGYAKDESGYARSIWRAAMENAARICSAARLSAPAYWRVSATVGNRHTRAARLTTGPSYQGGGEAMNMGKVVGMLSDEHERATHGAIHPPVGRRASCRTGNATNRLLRTVTAGGIGANPESLIHPHDGRRLACRKQLSHRHDWRGNRSNSNL